MKVPLKCRASAGRVLEDGFGNTAFLFVEQIAVTVFNIRVIY